MRDSKKTKFGDSITAMGFTPIHLHSIGDDENERIDGLSENEKISCKLHSSLTVFEVERDFGKNSIQWRKSR